VKRLRSRKFKPAFGQDLGLSLEADKLRTFQAPVFSHQAMACTKSRLLNYFCVAIAGIKNMDNKIRNIEN
jgi:hypothetical protein